MKRVLACFLAIPLWPVVIVVAALLAIAFPIGWVWATLTD